MSGVTNRQTPRHLDTLIIKITFLSNIIWYLFWNPVTGQIGYFGGPQLAHGLTVDDHWFMSSFLSTAIPSMFPWSHLALKKPKRWISLFPYRWGQVHQVVSRSYFLTWIILCICIPKSIYLLWFFSSFRVCLSVSSHRISSVSTMERTARFMTRRSRSLWSSDRFINSLVELKFKTNICLLPYYIWFDQGCCGKSELPVAVAKTIWSCFFFWP